MDMLKRTAVIGEIVKRKQKLGGQLGKTALMKLLHLLQEGLDMPLGYRFTLYNYGPYDTEVMSDIEFAESLGLINIQYEGPEQGYRIQPNPSAGQVISQFSDPIGKLDKLMEYFGSMNARDLELRSTLLFLSHDFQEDALVDRLLALKPKYVKLEVRSVLTDLKQKGLVE
jgi:uncharacterized protein